MIKTVRIIGIPIDLGQEHRGVDMGPIAIRYAGLGRKIRALGYSTKDSGNINVPGHYTLTTTHLDERIIPIEKACRRAYALGQKAIQKKEIPIFLGGDHSVAIGTVGGVTHNNECGVIWIDAHGDANTPKSSPSGNIHGMALATLLGKGPKKLRNVGRKGPKIKASNVVMIGIRELDHLEKTYLANSGCHVYTMRAIDERGIYDIMQEALTKLSHLTNIHVSLDMDAIDPQEAPGVGTPSPGGITYREAQLIMETLADSGKVQSADVVEINPILDIQNRTAQVAVTLITSLLGKSII